jgi:hypothetical protein
MGAEELKKRRPAHDKYIDRQRVALATPDLFTQTPEDQRAPASLPLFQTPALSSAIRIFSKSTEASSSVAVRIQCISTFRTRLPTF